MAEDTPNKPGDLEQRLRWHIGTRDIPKNLDERAEKRSVIRNLIAKLRPRKEKRG